MKLIEAKTRMQMLINEYSRRGEIINPTSSNILDDYIKFNHYLDIAQKVVASSIYIKAKVSTTLLNEQYIETTDQTQYESSQYENKVIYNTSTQKVYRIIKQNASTYAATELTNTILPLNDRYEYQLPNNFYKFLSARIKNGSKEVLYDAGWRLENKVIVDENQSGLLTIEYAKIPTNITESTDDEYEFEIKETSQLAMIYYATALVLQLQNVTAYYMFMQMYEELMNNAINHEGTRPHKVRKVY